jgi:hypothetical protein
LQALLLKTHPEVRSLEQLPPVAVQAELAGGTVVDLKPFDIDQLADEFPDC